MDAPDEQLEWRDTYFILLQESARPTLMQVEGAIKDASKRLRLENLTANDDGMFESVLVHAPQDNAALEINYESGDAVVAQSTDLAKQLQEDLTPAHLARILSADARLDVMLFERVKHDAWSDAPVDDGEEWEGGALDPASLLCVVEALTKLTKGLPIDPASGGVLL